MNRDFLKEAIADAKAVKESAIANAKIALEEAFNPQLKSMLSAKLEEMDKTYEEDDVTEEVNEDEVSEETIDETISEEKDEMDEEMKDELNEAYATIKSLKSELQEINLLNAKLLYSNKIFKAKTLSEAQKVKVLGTFDKATTVKEVKLVFETINESLKTKTTKRISENLIGSASRVTRTPKRAKKPILESNAMVSRFQKLAGITKNN